MLNNLNDAVIVSACRTPIGKIGGALSSIRPDDLLAMVLKEALARAGILPNQVDEVMVGCANQAGEDNRNVARIAVLLAGLPQKIPGVTINRLCASGLDAFVQATRAIRTNEAQVVIVGGVESMSRSPWVMGKPDKLYPVGPPNVYDTALGWRFPNPKLAAQYPLESMGETAENLAEHFKISRKEQDEFALRSHLNAIVAQNKGMFKTEIMPVHILQKNGADIIITKDESPRADTSMLKLSNLPAVFRKDGTVTAGNSSTLNDGASALVVTSREFARAHGLKVLAKYTSMGVQGVNPRIMGIGPVPATNLALQRARLSMADIGVVELNEAFASQSLAVIKELKIDLEKVNQRGGAIALGHPLGCSGARILTTLLGVLQNHPGEFGLATMCVGVGQGLSVILEKE